MSRRAALLLSLAIVSPAAAQSAPTVPYPRDYKTHLVKYAVVDRIDGMSRDLYVSRDAIEALRRNPSLKEFPAGVLFALDVHSARATGRDPRSGATRFEARPDGHLVRSKDERTLHLMQKTQPGFGSQNWTFAGFDPVTSAPLKIQLPGDCQLCHQQAVVRDMTFSIGLLRRYVESGAVQYSFCSQPGRQACALP